MGTVNVTHVVKDLKNDPIDGIEIRARLSEPGFRSDDSEIPTLQIFYTDSTGTAVLELEAQADITPGGATTYYVVDVLTPPDQGGSKRHTIRATSNQSLQNSIVVI